MFEEYAAHFHGRKGMMVDVGMVRRDDQFGFHILKVRTTVRHHAIRALAVPGAGEEGTEQGTAARQQGSAAGQDANDGMELNSGGARLGRE